MNDSTVIIVVMVMAMMMNQQKQAPAPAPAPPPPRDDRNPIEKVIDAVGDAAQGARDLFDALGF